MINLLIIKYLRLNYFILNDNSVGAIKGKSKVRSHVLREELVLFFNITELTATTSIEVWIESSYHSFDFKTFWLVSFTYRCSGTIATDLVSVQPLGMPINDMFYLDISYDEIRPNNGRVYTEECMNQAVEDFQRILAENSGIPPRFLGHDG